MFFTFFTALFSGFSGFIKTQLARGVFLYVIHSEYFTRLWLFLQKTFLAVFQQNICRQIPFFVIL